MLRLLYRGGPWDILPLSGSLHVESETLFIYKLMFSVHVVITIQGGEHIQCILVASTLNAH